MPPSTSPAHPTQIRKRLTKGRLVGVDGSVWLCRAVPMAPVLDAKDSRSLTAANRPISAAIDELAGLATTRTDRRSINKSSYRRVQILSVDIPRRFTPPDGHPQATRLQAEYAQVAVRQRVTLFVVRLTDRLGGDDGLRAAIDSITESLVAGGAPISDYDPDVETVDAICARVGMRVPTDDEIRVAAAWWNYGWVPEVIDLEHLDHLHVFASPDSARAAAGIGEENCERFAGMSDHATFAFGAVEDFDLPFFSVEEDDPAAAWGAKLMALGATVVSIRGLCEPPQVTRGELRRHRKKFLDDLSERANSRHGSLSRAEQEEMLGDLTGMEGLYAGAGPATLVDTSIVVGFAGMGDRGYDLSELGVAAGLRIAPMVRRQRAAWSETMLCSPVSASPYLHDLPSHMVAAAGLTSLSTVGDGGFGALVGFTERDRQPAWLSPVAASNEDELPLAVVVGQSGSGKLLSLANYLPTPTGRTRMGDISVGDRVIGRDGRPCRVTFLSEVNEHPDLYRVCLDDGQEVLADADHQWVVSTFQERNGRNHPHHATAVLNWEEAQKMAEALEALGDRFDADHESTAKELFALIGAEVPGAPWSMSHTMLDALRFVGCPYRMQERTVPRRMNGTMVKTDPAVLFPFEPTLRALLEYWKGAGAANMARWGAQIESRVAAVDSMLGAVVSGTADGGEELTIAEIHRRLRAAGADVPLGSKGRLADVARRAGVTPRQGTATTVMEIPERERTTRQPRVILPTALACKALALRLRQQYGDRPSEDYRERVMTTSEMLVEGIRLRSNGARFATRLAAPLELPEAELSIDPYVLGAWLGDGDSNGGGFTGVDPEITDEIVNVGYTVTHSATTEKAHYIKGLIGDLRRAGVRNNKHIPDLYLRASDDQRLALLQGIMDTDGTVGRNGSCELTFTNERLSMDSLELIRSLGIKASVVSSPAEITEDDPDRPGHKRRRVTGTRWRIHFTPDRQVFRLSRKAERCKTETRETARWLYITSITPVPPEPGRCIQVDSPDHTYLVEGFVPTHNTMTMLHLATQFAGIPTAKGENTPVVVLDPKALALDTPVPTPRGERTMGELAVGDQVFDRNGKLCAVTELSPILERPELYELVFDDGQTLHADGHHRWVVLDFHGRNMAMADNLDRDTDTAALVRCLDAFGDSDTVSGKVLFEIIVSAGCKRWSTVDSLHRSLRIAGVGNRGVDANGRFTGRPARLAIKTLLNRVNSDFSDNELMDLNTNDLLSIGVKRNGQTRWAVPVAEPVEMPDADLPIDPWLLGAWLGDGGRGTASIACGDADLAYMLERIAERWPTAKARRYGKASAWTIMLTRDTDRCPYGHSERVVTKKGTHKCAVCASLSHQIYRLGRDERERVNPAFVERLRLVGVLERKHIPLQYKLASAAQRMELLRGLMDTDGTVKRRGDCRISLSDPVLASDVVDLVRSLGIKANCWTGPGEVTVKDPQAERGHRRHRVKDAHCIAFRTTRPVFGMPRKLELLPERDSVRSRFRYITEIRAIPPRPARCICVDSPDHTYLAGGYAVTHNSESNLAPAVETVGGQVASLDDITSGDGIYDPIRFSPTAQAGVELAASLLGQINPWGSKAADFETPLLQSLAHGVERGATCIGEALQIAQRDRIAPTEMVERVFALSASPLFRACVGFTPGTTGLRVADGVTYIRVGGTYLDLPAPGATNITQTQRISAALIRMMVFGSAMALTGRQGVVMLDEAWVFVQAGRAELERLGRLARSQQVLPMLFTQFARDILDEGLAGAISRGLVLSFREPDEARAALELFRIEPTPERLERLLGPATIGGIDGSTTAPNWSSFRALRDFETRKVLRGSVALYSDLHRRAVPVEVVIPPSLFLAASTNPEDIRRREAMRTAARQAAARA